MAQMGQQSSQSTQTGMTGQGASLSEREFLQLALNETKLTAAAVNTYALEASSDTLRRDYLTILGEVHNAEKQVFNLMQQKGYYDVKDASQQEISQVQSKFSQMQ